MKISVIGAGAMGGSTVKGLLKGETFKPADITLSDPSQEALGHFADTGVSITTDNQVAAESADIVAVGVSSEQVNGWMKKEDRSLPPLYLVIHNIAIAVMNSMTFIVPVNASEASIKLVSEIFDEMGGSIITEERLLGAGTTLASCGIAYAMRYVRAAVEGGVELGFKAKDAEKIVLQTVKGAVELLQANGNHPEAEIDKVTTPGGVTIKGLNEMEHAGFTSAVIRGLKAGLK